MDRYRHQPDQSYLTSTSIKRNKRMLYVRSSQRLSAREVYNAFVSMFSSCYWRSRQTNQTTKYIETICLRPVHVTVAVD